MALIEDRVLARVQCAAITRGCPASIVFPVRDGVTDAETAVSEARGLLEINGWHQDHGEWVCGAHPVRSEG